MNHEFRESPRERSEPREVSPEEFADYIDLRQMRKKQSGNDDVRPPELFVPRQVQGGLSVMWQVFWALVIFFVGVPLFLLGLSMAACSAALS